MDLLKIPLFSQALGPRDPDPHAEPRKRLLDALLQMRERARMLAGEIHRDLPDFTVHDITHLDALWEMADLIAGPDYPLNPLEAFALGAVFLLHDLGLGLAAYPGGLAELKKGPGWQDALSTYLRKHLERIPTAEELASPPPEVERMAVQERLRVLHAEQAERLALTPWRHGGGPEYHLIDDPDLRLAIGSLLGKIAHSHWWPVSRLGNEFGTIRGALTNCPRDWTLDPLKVAVLLRAADAAHLDERRAPGFLIAFRRPEGLSKEHWRFQNHLLKPQVADDRLVYTTNRPFPPEEVNDWWLCEETLRMVDRELHHVDSLLADRGYPPRLRVRGVAGADSPRRLQEYIEVSGWTPVDARLHVSNVASLARKMGGEQLYGADPTVPLRELIQNASDAVRARRLLEDRPSDWGHITVQLGRDEQGPWVEVTDTGVGMSEGVLTGSLLDFGTSYWDSALMREEHKGLWGKGFEPTGRFGIGFFSVFMWGHRVSVTTRRYDEGLLDTRVLEFQTGLSARPLVRPAQRGECMLEGGTRVRVWLNKEPNERGGLLNSHITRNFIYGPVDLGDLCAWIAPALGVDLYAGNGNVHPVVAASDWLAIDGTALLKRLSFGILEGMEPLCGPSIRTLNGPDGHVLGRATVFRAGGESGILGVVVTGGIRAGVDRDIAGILVGTASGIARADAVPAIDDNCRVRWISSQAAVIAENVNDPKFQATFGKWILSLGGDSGPLLVAKMNSEHVNNEYVSLDYLAHWHDAPDEIALVRAEDGQELSQDEFERLGFEEPPPVIIVFPKEASPWVFVYSIARAWRCSPGEISMEKESDYIMSSYGEYRKIDTFLLRAPEIRATINLINSLKGP